jgi:tetratricopeptide (TPR) repeat protein
MPTRPNNALLFVGLICSLLAVAVEPPEAMQHARASYELAKRGDLAAAAEEMRISIRLAPENPLYLSALGGIVSRQGNLQEARECFSRAVKIDPQNPKLRSQLEQVSLDLGEQLAKQRRFKAGALLAEDAGREFPESARVQQMLGFFRMRNHQNPAAVDAYGRALSLSPESGDINVGLGIAQTAAGMLAQAAQTLQAGITKWPNDATQYQAYGVLLLRMADEGSASEDHGAEMLRKALSLDVSLSEAHYQLGNRALRQGKTDDAIEHLSMALRNGDQSSKVYFALSRAYRAAGNSQESEKYASVFREQKQRELQAESRQ